MIKSKERVYNGFFNVDNAEIETKSGKKIYRELVDRGESVCALVYNPKNNKIILVSQFRVGSNKDMIELVAGMLENGENPIDSISREVLEETGYETKTIEKVTEFYTSPGGSSEKMHLFYVVTGEKIEKGGGLESENEEIEIIEMSLSEFKNAKFDDAKTIIGQLWYNK